MKYDFVLSDANGQQYSVNGIEIPQANIATIADALANYAANGLDVISYAVESALEGPVYRLLLIDPSNGIVASGATYPGCNPPDNSGPCQAISFADMNDALYYSQQHNEIPYLTSSAEEAYAIANGTQAINPANILPYLSGETAAGPGLLAGISNTTLLAGAAVAAFLLFGKRRSRSVAA